MYRDGGENKNVVKILKIIFFEFFYQGTLPVELVEVAERAPEFRGTQFDYPRSGGILVNRRHFSFGGNPSLLG